MHKQGSLHSASSRKKDSVTTPIRIVYNCSCRENDSSPCLDDCLATYPPIMTDLTDILVRFRMYKYAVTADIEKAFLHIDLMLMTEMLQDFIG